MTNDDPRAESGPEGGEPAGGADAWLAQWTDIFRGSASGPEPTPESSPESSSDPGEPGPAGELEPDGELDLEPDAEPEADQEASRERSSGARRSPESNDVAAIEAWQRAQERNRRQARIRAHQRAARQIRSQLPEGSSAHLTGPLAAGVQGRGDSTRRLGLVGVGLVLVIAGLAVYLMLGFGGEPVGQQAATVVSETTPTDSTDGLDLTVGADVTPASSEELALSTVQLVGLDDDLQPQCAGSGVIVTTDGTILTNAHVVRSDADCRFTTVGVGMTDDSSSPPRLLYRADVVLLRLGVDLAVLQISGPLSEDLDAPWPTSFPAAPLGDSDTVELGDEVRILGYPLIGGNTITLTSGSVGGFTSQAGLGNRALIKSDASISAGNSGGMAVDADGRVIGIPTKARASEQGPAVDCRPVSDTDGDGDVDDDDACVTVGGFLNGIRPINLSLPLLAAAGASDPTGSDDEPAPAPAPVDLTKVELFNPRFARGVNDDDLPVDEVITIEAGVAELCFFVDWEGIPAEASIDGAWYLDNELQVSQAVYSGRIREEDTGQLYWLCIETDDEVGLAPGVYEVVFYVDRQVAFVEAIEVTPEPVEQVEVTWKNMTGVPLCQLAINPLAVSRQIGLNELPNSLIIAADGEWTVDLPVGSFVVEASDCSGEPVANEFTGLVITEPVVLQIDS